MSLPADIIIKCQALDLTAVGERVVHLLLLIQGGSPHPAMTVRLLAGADDTPHRATPAGQLVLHIGGPRARVPSPRDQARPTSKCFK